LAAQNHSFESIGAFGTGTLSYSGGEVPEQVREVQVTANFLSLLGVGFSSGAISNPATSKSERRGLFC